MFEKSSVVLISSYNVRVLSRSKHELGLFLLVLFFKCGIFMAGLSLYGFGVFYFSEKALCNSVLFDFFLTVSPESESLFSYHMDKCKNKPQKILMKLLLHLYYASFISI